MSASTKKTILFCLTAAIIGGTAFALTQVRNAHHLGKPGVRAEAIPGSTTMKISLPENVLDFTSSNLPTSDTVLGYLPKDTSYAQRQYSAPDGFWVLANLILMGADRTSIHRPDYCLPGQGWQITGRSAQKIHIEDQGGYDLPVQKWTIYNTFDTGNGQKQSVAGVYVFWFVAENNQTDDYGTIQKSILLNLVRHGVLERWAYASYFALCAPGQEDAAFERMKGLIAKSVPSFQPRPAK